MNRLLRVVCILAPILPIPSPLLADDFDRLEGRTLAAIPEQIEAVERLTLADLSSLPNALQGVRSPVLVVQTGRGNPSRLIIAPGFWSPPPTDGDAPDEQAEPVPILVLERFATFEGAGGSSPDRLASGRDVFLFDGFHYDLDSGQVVPEGQGGDLAFFASGDEVDDGAGPRIEAVGGASLFPMTEAPEFAEPSPGLPSPGRAILPIDYAGRFRLQADGSLSGTLDLTIDGRAASGQFRSDQSGSSYEVVGEVEPGTDPGIRFSIQFPRSRQDYQALLFSEGKAAMAGTFLLVDRDRPFFAIREAVSPPEPEDDQP